jgi:hypothetical protein
MMPSTVLDANGQPRPPYAGPAVAAVITRTCWLCHGSRYIETGLQEFSNVGVSCRCSICGGTGYVSQEVAA